MRTKPIWTYLFSSLLLPMSFGCGDTTDGTPSNTDPSSTGGTDTEKDTSDAGDEDTGFTAPLDPDIDNSICKDVGSGSRVFTIQYQSGVIPVDNSDKTYMIHTNWWHAYDGQTVAYDGLAFKVRNPKNVDVGPTDGAPAGYPSIYIGSYSGKTSAESNLPILVSDIDSAPTVFKTNGTEGGLANKNAAYDVWFTADGEPLPATQYSPELGGAYLMIWTFDPPDRQPRGTNDHPGHTVDGVDGSWDVWVHNTNPPCISYVRTDPVDDLEFDLNHFIRDSVENGYGITDEMYLSVIFAGFEIWGGGHGLTVNRFCADVNSI
jgi:hypothetical protein